MTDRELLEMAAKAAGIAVVWGKWMNRHEWLVHHNTGDLAPWNPLTDDGDALRLAAHLKIDIKWQPTNPFPKDTVGAYHRKTELELFCAMYPEKDYRRAIVRAAAEIGRGME